MPITLDVPRNQKRRFMLPPRFHLQLLLIPQILARVSFAVPAAIDTSAALPTQGYTNHAGHVLYGSLVAADAKSVTLRLANGTKRSLPLSIFPPSERERIGIASGTLAPPPAVAEAFERCRQALQRLDVLVQVGQQSEESAQKSRELERQSVRTIIADLERRGQLAPAAAAFFAARVP